MLSADEKRNTWKRIAVLESMADSIMEEENPAPMRVPSPGCELAISMGCTCSETENEHGKGVKGDNHVWYVTKTCPLHGHVPEHAKDI